MKILVVAQYYRPDITAAAFRIAETADLLSELGHEVTVITSEPHRAQAAPEGDATPRDAAASGATARGGATTRAGAALAETPALPGQGGAGAAIHRVPIDPLSGGGMGPYLRHFFSFVFRARRAARRLLRDGYQPDVVWVSSPPLFVGLVGTAIRRWSRVPLVLDIRDVWPDTAVAAGQLSADGRAYRIGRRLEHWLYRRADALSCVAAPMADYLRREISAAGGVVPPIEVVYNGAGFSLPEPLPPGEIRPRVLYAGNLGRLQGVDALLAAWASIEETARTGWTLDLIGTGVMEDQLREQSARSGIADTVRFCGVRSKAETVEEMRRAGVLFLNLLARPVFDLTIPSKLFDYLATGRPIIGGIMGEGRRILAELPGNHPVQPNDAGEIAAALREIIARSGENAAMPPHAPDNQRVVAERYSRRVNAERLAGLFSTVCAAAHDA